MNTIRIIGYGLLLFFFTAFKASSACEYAGSNINFVKTQTEIALTKNNLNLVRYHTFKAINALDKSKKELKACKCEYAAISLEESAYLLRQATRTENIVDSKELLTRSLQNTISGMDAVKNHDEQHTIKKSDDLLALNEDPDKGIDNSIENPKKVSFKEKLDASLENYRASLNIVVRTVNCSDAKAFAEGIYENCEQELLKEGLSEQKKYYNLKTKEITAEALTRIQEKCEKE